MKTSFAAIAALALLAIPAVASAGNVTFYDPASKENGESHFVTVAVNPNPANAEAAKADAARYAAADQSGALIATHGDAGAQIVSEFDPAAGSGDPRFVSHVVIANPANAEAAKADAARYPKPVFYSSDSEDEAAKIRG